MTDRLLKKPEKKTSSYWVYREVIDYIEQKYNIQTRGYTPKDGFTNEQLEDRSDYDKKYNNKPDLDFWYWIINNNEINNGCLFTLYYDPDDEYVPDWVKEILEIIFDEFEPEYDEMEMYVSW